MVTSLCLPIFLLWAQCSTSLTSPQPTSWKLERATLLESAEQEHTPVDVDATASRPTGRRLFGSRVAQCVGLSLTTCALGVASIPPQASAASAATATLSQTEKDKAKIYAGYQRLTYFLDNWVQETTVCGRSGDNPYISKGGCERTPEKVMDYLGYKSTTDPLFRADVTMRRLESLVPPDKEGEYLDAIEKWMEAADSGNGLAFVSSWGEANPGGGKDRVELFIERARKSVTDARDSLVTIVEILEITKAT